MKHNASCVLSFMGTLCIIKRVYGYKSDYLE
jgi:hypothetical protein